MDMIFWLLVVLVGFSLVLRSANITAQKSAQESLRREVLREYLRKKRLDELYGRNNEER